MKNVVLLGTSHSIQLGNNSPSSFKEVLIHECKSSGVRGIAEEIRNGDKTIALQVAGELSLAHLYADPDTQERIAEGIEIHIESKLMDKYGDEFPEIRFWPKSPSIENLPERVWKEYYERTKAAYRAREKVWFRRITNFDLWPLLFICGAEHFDEFAKLLEQEGIKVLEAHHDWEPR